jgi:hypothetical protein
LKSNTNKTNNVLRLLFLHGKRGVTDATSFLPIHAFTLSRSQFVYGWCCCIAFFG